MTEPEHGLTAIEWRLYIVAVLAGVYVVAWGVLDRPGRAPRAALARAAPRSAIWLDTLPPDQRPTIVPPVGWTIAERVAPSFTPDPRLTRTPAPRRARTRSS